MSNSSKNWFKIIGNALSGKSIDLTEESLNKSILMLAIPMIVEMGMESIFAVVDMYFVGKISVNAVTTITLTESVMMILFSVAIGLSMGVTAIVARRIGEKKPEQAAIAGVQSIWIAIVASLLFAIAGIFGSEQILGIMGAEPEVIAEGKGYTQILMGGNLTIMLLFLINAIFRGAGNASIAMRVLIISNGINLILDPLFIFGIGPFEGWGIEGAAIATTTGRGIGVLFQLYYLFKGTEVLRVTTKHIQFVGETIMNILKISLGGIGQFLIGTGSWIFLVKISSQFGTEVIAGYGIAIRVLMFTILPSWGLANAGATLVGQNLGAQKPDRAEQAVWKCAKYNLVFLFFVSLVFIFAAKNLISIFTENDEVIEIGAMALQYIGFGYIMYAYGMVIGQAFNGAGDTKTPTMINLFCFWFFEIPLAYLLAIVFEFGPQGIFSAISLAIVVHAITCIVIFRKGNWKKVKV